MCELTSPLLLKPRISKLMLEVLPVWISCRCLNRLRRARPRPLSSSPCVRTPSRVDFPESTFPRTATRRSRNCQTQPEVRGQRSGVWGEDQRKPHLLVVRDFPDQNFCDFAGVSVRVVVHLSLSEEGDVSTHSDGGSGGQRLANQGRRLRLLYPEQASRRLS